MKISRIREGRVFAILLVFSGFCGISYEILYARVLGNLVGDQMLVSASILMTFLLGIGFGTYFAHRLWRHLWLIEASIGICGIFFALVGESLDGFIFSFSEFFGHSLFSSAMLCVLLLAIPAFAIGCSLPIFAGYLSLFKEGKVFSKAYTLYNFGAASTALIIEFYLLREFGLSLALLVIASLNIIVAVILYYAYRDLRESRPKSNPELEGKFSINIKTSLILVSLASAVFQLLAIKVSECLVGPFRETFALVLAIVLLCIALGAMLVDRLKLSFRSVMIINISGLILFMLFFENVAEYYASLYPEASESYIQSILLKFNCIFTFMALPSLSFGATIPALMSSEKNVAKESGQLLFISSISNALGFMLMAFVLHRYLDYGQIILVILGLSILAFMIHVKKDFRSHALAFAFIAIIWSGFSHWKENLLYLGYTAFHSKEDLEKQRDELDFAHKYKGYQDIFAIVKKDGSERFFINGYLSIPLNHSSEKIVGAFSSIFAPKADKALVLGVGSGATANTVGQLFDHTDAIEINPVVLENLFRMKSYNFDIENNPKVNIVLDDAIHFTKITPNKYSLIINTVTTPLYFSSAKLYTDDFLKHINGCLKPGGIYMTWVDSRVGNEGLDIVLNTIKNNFNYCSIAAVKSSYFLLLCSSEKPQPHLAKHVASNKVLQDYFVKKHNLLPEHLPYGLLLGNAFDLISDKKAPMNTLDFPSLEFSMTRLRKRGISKFKSKLKAEMQLQKSRELFKGMDWNPMQALVYREELLGKNKDLNRRWIELLKQSGEFSQDKLEAARIAYFKEVCTKGGTSSNYYYYGKTLYKGSTYTEAIKAFNKALALNSRKNNANYYLGMCYKELGDIPQAIQYFKEEIKLDRDKDARKEIDLLQGGNHFRLGKELKKSGNYKLAIEKFNKVVIANPTRNDTHYYIGYCLEMLNELDAAEQTYLKELKIDPKDNDIPYRLGRIQSKRGQHEAALKHFELALKVKPKAKVYRRLAECLILLKRSQEATEILKKARQRYPQNSNFQ